MAPATGADQRRGEPKVSLPPPIRVLVPAKPGQDAFDANVGNHVGLGITDVVGRGRAGQRQVLYVGRRSEGTEARTASVPPPARPQHRRQTIWGSS